MKSEQLLTITYPIITDKLIECLERDFPDKIPRKQLSDYEFGRLVGNQEVIDKLKAEKRFMEEEIDTD